MTNRLAIILALATTAYGQEVSAISADGPTKPVATVSALSVAFPDKKTWFAKLIGDKVFVGGRPTERAIKYLGEEGFKSIITLGTDSAAGTFGDAAVPSSADEATLAFDSGLDFITVDLQGGASDFPTVVSTAFADFKAKLAAAPRPTYVHDDRNGATAAFFTSLVVLKADAAKVAAVEDQHRFGWWGEAEPNIQGAFSKLYVAETGASAAPAAPSPQVVNQTAYWWAKRVTDRFYIAGQIWKNNLPAIKAAGFKSIVNFRTLPTDVKGAPSQEEVTLLNVDHTATYKNGESFRQKPANLEPKRIFPAAANAYIDIEGRTGSSVNYEVTNAQEFGDDVGYHAQIEEAAVKAAGLDYVGIPLGGPDTGYTTEFVAKNIEPKISALVKAGKTPILLHCRTAVRAIFGAATYEVLVAKTVSADKAIAGANLVGYSYKTAEDNTTQWTNFGGVLTSTYTTAAAATATTGASDATPPPPKSTTAPLSRAVTDTATNSVKVTSGIVRSAVSGVGLVLAAVVAAALAL